MKLSRLSALAAVACASLAFAAPAFAGNDRDDPKPTSATATSNPTVTNSPTFTNAPKIDVTGGTSTLGSLNKFGGDGGTALAGADANAASLSAAASKSQAGADAAAYQAQQQKQLNDQRNQQSVVTGANTVGAIAPVQAVNISTPKQFRDAPDVQGSVIVNVASCAMGDGASVAFPGGGGQLTKSRVDPGCDTRADVAVWLSLGMRDVAINRMYGMSSKEAYDLADQRRNAPTPIR